MKTSLTQWIKQNSVLLANTGSLIGTMVVTSVLGSAYWWLAARRFTTAAVGLASASTSAMMFIASCFLLGLGTLLISELPRNKGHEGSLISAAVLLVGGVSVLGGALFAVLAPFISPDLRPIGANIQNILLFAAGVSLTAVTVILDQAVIGLLRGGLQLWRNALFSVAKLALLFLLSLWLTNLTGMTIYAAWTIGNAISLIPLLAFAIWFASVSRQSFRPRWSMFRKLGRAAIQHHILNLVLQAPSLALPMLVTIMLSASLNAWYYVASMIANFVFTISLSLTTVLHAVNAAQPATLARKARMTIALATVMSLLANIFLFIAGPYILNFFGASYAEHAVWSLRILSLGAFPLIIKNHYISIRRIKDEITNAIIPITLGSVLELGAAVVGARLGSLNGLSLGWVLAMGIEALIMAPLVISTVWRIDAAALASEEEARKNSGLLEEDLLAVAGNSTDAFRSLVFMDSPTMSLPIIDIPAARSWVTSPLADAPTESLARIERRQALADEPTRSMKRLEPEDYEDDEEDLMAAPTIKMVRARSVGRRLRK